MPASPALVVEDSAGSERFSLACIRAERRDSLIEMWTATAVVDRAEWLAVNDTIEEVADRFRIERGDGSTFFEGRFRTDERDGDTILVRINSYEQDAIDAEPTAGLEVFQNVDDSVVASDAISDIPTLSAGTIETGATGVSFTFAHAERSKQLRDASDPGGMDIRYNFDRTVDFVQRLGSDKPGVTVSNTDQSIVNSLSVTEDSRDPVTHIRGLGAEQGENQVQAEAVIASYSAGDRQVWREYVNKDIVNQDRLQEIVNRLAGEYDSARRRLTVKAGLLGVDVNVGDRVTVDIPPHDIDRLLRIVTLREIIGPNPRYEATLTNRVAERGGNRKRRDDLQRFNTGWQGFVDRDNDSYGWQPVTAATNATRPYQYPSDVVSEKRAEVYVSSIPYRAYSQGSANLDSPNFDLIQNRSVVTNERLSPGQSFTFSAPVPSFEGESSVDEVFNDYVLEFLVDIEMLEPDNVTVGSQETIGLSVRAGGTVQLFDGEVTTDSFGNLTRRIVNTTVEPGENIEWTVTNVYSSGDILISDNSGLWMWDFDHTHPPEPGLIDFPNTTASNVDLIVNGTTVATDIGTGTFNTTVDIAGQMSAGVNTIELSSDSLGLLNATVITQLFRQGTP